MLEFGRPEAPGETVEEVARLGRPPVPRNGPDQMGTDEERCRSEDGFPLRHVAIGVVAAVDGLHTACVQVCKSNRVHRRKEI